jgi:hypothetical protein
MMGFAGAIFRDAYDLPAVVDIGRCDFLTTERGQHCYRVELNVAVWEPQGQPNDNQGRCRGNKQ